MFGQRGTISELELAMSHFIVSVPLLVLRPGSETQPVFSNTNFPTQRIAHTAFPKY